MTPAPALAESAIDPLQGLQSVFGFSEFRPHQEEVVRTALSGRDALIVMPTGAGKSLCYQLPAALTPGVTLVVSPLVALMRDQVEALRERTEFRRLGVAYINSLQRSDEQNCVLDMLRNGGLKLLYVAPERFRSQGFLDAMRGVRIARFVVDEAHCISEWGHDFRPDYLALKDVSQSLGRPPILAATATATQRVQSSIISNLAMTDPAIVVGGFNRENLHFSVHRCKGDRDRGERLAKALPKLASRGGSGLIYVATRKQADEIAILASEALASVGLKAAPYHAGLDSGLRNQLQSQWLSGEIHTLVATNAFGMGIDKPDVRFVVHYVYPESLESYYQEAGRAGRDRRKSRCVILYSFSDKRLREFFIDNDALTSEAVRQAHSAICSRAQADAPAAGQIVRISRSWWGLTLRWNELKTRLAMAELERLELIDRVGESTEETFVRIVNTTFPASAARRIDSSLERQKAERHARLNEMIAYCRTPACRRRTLLGYFGDDEDVLDSGYCCDNCEEGIKPTRAPRRARADLPDSRVRVASPSQIDASDIHAILQGLDGLWPQVGKSRLNKILRGSNSKEVERFRDSPLLGVFRGVSEAAVNAFVENLIDTGLMHQADEDDYFVCTITRAGRQAWQMKTPLDIALPISSRAAATHHEPLDPEQERQAQEIFERLRQWRRGHALARNVPPYVILGDRTLTEIARVRPDSEETLRAITGIGEVKIRDYGQDILSIVSDDSSPVVHSTDGGEISTMPAAPTPRGESRAGEERRRLAAAVAALSETVVESYVHLQEGFDIEEIARERELTTGTIWGHVESMVAEGFVDEVDFERLVPTSVRTKIEAAMDTVPFDSKPKAVFEALQGELDYGPIRCVMARRKRMSMAMAANAFRHEGAAATINTSA